MAAKDKKNPIFVPEKVEKSLFYAGAEWTPSLFNTPKTKPKNSQEKISTPKPKSRS